MAGKGANANRSVKAAQLTVSRTELLENGSDGPFRDLLYSFFEFSNQLQIARERFAAFIGLSPTQYMILIAIARLAEEEAGVAQIADRLYLSGAFVTAEINKLVALKLVKKAPHPTDGRRVVLKLSAEAEHRLIDLAVFQRPINDALFESLDKKGFDSLRATMARLAEDSNRALALSDYMSRSYRSRVSGN